MKRKTLRRIIFLLVFTLVFEGILRKFVPGAVSKLLIFAKDGICLLILFQVLQMRPKGRLASLLDGYSAFAVLLVPLIAMAAYRDPLLAVFGAKQYLLFACIGVAVPLAFASNVPRNSSSIAWVCALMVLPAVGLALVQVVLPSSHWLNLSVSGEDLSGFSAGGRMRVSGTFPFVSQFSWFLTFVLGAIVLTFFLPPRTGWRALVTKPFIIFPLFILGNFLTGSRQAVLGNLFAMLLGAGFLLMRGRGKNLGRLGAFAIGIVVALVVSQIVFPEAFVAYETRTEGSGNLGLESAEFGSRIGYALFGWTWYADYVDPGPMGYGLGVMSNGVQQISGYAASVRERVGWGEVDLANTFLEGGPYLVIIWMGFRLFVIYLCLRAYFEIRSSVFQVSGAFMLAYIIINGLFGTLGIQPPLQIWWWLAIGMLFTFVEAERLYIASKRSGTSGSDEDSESLAESPAT